MHWSASAYAHADKCFYFKQVHMLTHAAYHSNSSVQRVTDQWQVPCALCNFFRKTWCLWWHKVHMNQLENCQARYRSNTWMGWTRTDGPGEFEPSKFDCINYFFLTKNKRFHHINWISALKPQYAKGIFTLQFNIQCWIPKNQCWITLYPLLSGALIVC